MQRYTIAALMGFALVCDRPTAAQVSSDSGLARTSWSSVRQYIAGDAIARQIAAPQNVIVTEPLQGVIEIMLRRSPTFRRQCLRVQSEPDLVVRIDLSRSAAPGMRAKTRIHRVPGGLRAEMEIAPLEDRVELIAHEMEHVIEQLDGVDLRRAALLAYPHVRRVDSDREVYETVRAERTGRRVALEFRQ